MEEREGVSVSVSLCRWVVEWLGVSIGVCVGGGGRIGGGAWGLKIRKADFLTGGEISKVTFSLFHSFGFSAEFNLYFHVCGTRPPKALHCQVKRRPMSQAVLYPWTYITVIP